MTVHVEARLVCSECGKEYREIGESVRDVRKLAKDDGWVYCMVKNESYWDLCHECYTDEKCEPLRK